MQLWLKRPSIAPQFTGFKVIHMPTYRPFLSVLIFFTHVLLLAFSAALAANDDASTRQELDFNFDWKFSLGAQSGAQAPEFDDSSWRELRLPHDWSIEAE